MMPSDKRMLQANPSVTPPTYPVRLDAEEIVMLGQRRWSRAHRQAAQIAAGVMMFTGVYTIAILMQLRGPAGRWMILGLALPLAVLMFVGYREGTKAKAAGREFLKDVKGQRH